MTTPELQAAVDAVKHFLDVQAMDTTKAQFQTILDALEAAQAEVVKLTAQNVTFRNAQKICEDCDAPTKQQFLAAQKDRDCWLFNAQELQKQVNKMEKELGELRKLINVIRKIGTGESQVAEDDTAGLQVIVEKIDAALQKAT